LQIASQIVKWVSLPALLIGSILSGLAANYQVLFDSVICVGSIILVQRAVRMKAYYWAAGFVAIVIVFSPVLLTVKIFLLMGVGCTAICMMLKAAFRTQPAPIN